MKIKYDESREEIDVGCIYADNCFECPFSDCICQADEMGIQGEELQQRRIGVREKAAYIKKLRDEGMKIQDIASSMEWPSKVVRRYLIIAKQEEKKKDAE